VAILNSRNAGLLYAVVPPSTNTNDFVSSFLSHGITSGGKNTGAAVLARTSFHSSILRLQSARSGSLYLAAGLEEIGQAESVVAFRVTTVSRQRRLFGLRSVLAPNVFCRVLASSPPPYSDRQRVNSARRSNALRPKSW
jgi:hypothetical protein